MMGQLRQRCNNTVKLDSIAPRSVVRLGSGQSHGAKYCVTGGIGGSSQAPRQFILKSNMPSDHNRPI